jgi:RecB family exonuclease
MFPSERRKIFRHHLVEEVPLTAEKTENGRVYTTPKGDRLRSVTTILGESLDKDWLIKWRKRLGEKKAKLVTEAAARRGSAVHDLCERYIKNEVDTLKGVMPILAARFRTVKTILDTHVDNVYGIELPLYSIVLGTAGRCDLVAEYDGVMTIIDYKTSTWPKTEDQILSYFLQSTVYSMMFERMYRIVVPKIAIIIVVDNEPNPLVFVKDRSQYVKQVLEIFHK